MTVANLITLIKYNTGVTTEQVSDDNMMFYINKVYKILINAIQSKIGIQLLRSAEEYIDGVVSTSEYTLTVPVAATAQIKKLEQVYIKTDSDDTYYKKARQVNLSDLPYTWDYYVINQSSGDPIFWLTDNTINIAPQFTSDTVGSAGNKQIWIIGMDSVIDLVKTGAETTILLDESYHNLIALGAGIEIYRKRQQFDRKNDASSEFKLGKENMINELTDKYVGPTIMTREYESNLE